MININIIMRVNVESRESAGQICHHPMKLVTNTIIYSAFSLVAVYRKLLFADPTIRGGPICR